MNEQLSASDERFRLNSAWLLLMLPLLISFLCVLLATSLALQLRPRRAMAYDMVAQKQADYSTDAQATIAFGALDTDVIAAATEDARNLASPTTVATTGEGTAVAALATATVEVATAVLLPTRIPLTATAAVVQPPAVFTRASSIPAATETASPTATPPAGSSTQPAPTTSSTRTPTPTPFASLSATPSPTPIPFATSTATATATRQPTATPTHTPFPTATRSTQSATAVPPTNTPVPPPTATAVPTTAPPPPSSTPVLIAATSPPPTPTPTETQPPVLPSPTNLPPTTPQARPTTTPSPSPTPPLLVATIRCISPSGDPNNPYTAYFAYSNLNPTIINIPVGPRNYFDPAPEDRGQPTVFLPAVVNVIFALNFDGQPITWHLEGTQATADLNTPRCQ